MTLIFAVGAPRGKTENVKAEWRRGGRSPPQATGQKAN